MRLGRGEASIVGVQTRSCFNDILWTLLALWACKLESLEALIFTNLLWWKWQKFLEWKSNLVACGRNPPAEVFNSFFLNQFLIFKNENVSHENLGFIKIWGAGKPGLAFSHGSKQLELNRAGPLKQGLGIWFASPQQSQLSHTQLSDQFHSFTWPAEFCDTGVGWAWSFYDSEDLPSSGIPLPPWGQDSTFDWLGPSHI